MRPSLEQWVIGICASLAVHLYAIAFLVVSVQPAMIERASGPVISVAGSLSGFTSDAEMVVQDSAEIVEANDRTPEIEPEAHQESEPLEARALTETASADAEPLETSAETQVKTLSPTVPLEERQQKPRPEKANEKKKQAAHPKSSVPKSVRDNKKKKRRRKAKRRRRSEGAAGRRGSSGGRRQSQYAGAAALSNFKGRVRARIAARARSAKGRGTVVVRFTVTASGGVANVRVVRGANSALNSAALRAVRGGFPPIPPGLPRRITFSVPITFK